jgi:long-chain acyl-CoA synthetase
VLVEERESGVTGSIESLLAQEVGALADLVHLQALARPKKPAFIRGEERLDHAELDELMDRIAAGLQRDGVMPGDTIAIAAATSIEYAAIFLAAARAGASVAPLPPGSTADSLAMMLADCAARHLFLDEGVAETLAAATRPIHARRVALDGSAAGQRFTDWLPDAERLAPVPFRPEGAFNVIYSSGTTGTPKGIVQSHRMRWSHAQRGTLFGYGPESVTLISTPLYSNTTLVSFLPGVCLGGTVVLMPRFDPAGYLRLAQEHRATHTMLVPVQYQRLLDHAEFDRFDLSSFRLKFCTSAPFSPELKARVLERWPGGLIEFFGMTEGGGSTMLLAHVNRDKLHTVGQPLPGNDIRILDEEGSEVPAGGVGEIVGHSPLAMMTGYHGKPEATAAAEWRDPTGKRFFRTGDLGRFDADGFLTVIGRKKDMIISGGFNVYPIDLESILAAHPAVREAAVIGAPSRRWGETPVAFVVLADESVAAAEDLRRWANERLGKTQRIAQLHIVESLPRNQIGKVLKRELRDRFRDEPLD